MVQLSLTSVRNNLFSNYYLENLIDKNREWQMDEHEAAFEEIKTLYHYERKNLEDYSEPMLEEHFLKKVFHFLHHDFEVQAKSERRKFPDYAFFKDDATRQNAHHQTGTKSLYEDALAVGEVKRWGVELDRFGKDMHDQHRNPSFQIWYYLQLTGRQWGLLTNGRFWRLYRRGKFMDTFFEIDLETLIKTEDIEQFRFFYYFFMKEAFLPDETGDTFLEKVFTESQDYGKAVGDNLKENVYKAMKEIAEGFFHWSENHLDLDDAETRVKVQKSTMRLLYRFLFLLYAEEKGLLNLSTEIYRDEYSFHHIKHKIKEKKEQSTHDFQKEKREIWQSLKDLFRLIDQGSEAQGHSKDEFHIPPYNGGLFDSARNPNLEKWDIGDKYLANAIDLLTRSKEQGREGFIDYSTLEIRHLGSIYEGLLEYKLMLADEDMVVKGGKKKRQWVTLDEFNKDRKQKKQFKDFDKFDRVEKGQLYLTTDKGERKATGSYYTPDYIVNYIVEHTVGPVVEERWKEAEESGKSLVDATLLIKVLDPAMGSGHFLVGAVEFLAGKLQEAVEEDIIKGRIEEDDHYTIDWAKREVVSHCIYGVDLNDLAVELAKVSLWLTTISKDRPLSFLDHRLKQGNSLIGADLADLPWHPDSVREEKARLDMTDVPEGFRRKMVEALDRLVQTVEEIESLDDDTLEHVRAKEKLFQGFRDTIEYDMIKTLANVRTSIYFGNEVDEKTYGMYSGDAFFSNEKQWEERRERQFARRARELSDNRHFFHWELEFPEIFFEHGGVKNNPGFDAVVGNPPYSDIKGLEKELVDYIFLSFPNTYYRINIFATFLEQAIKLSDQQKGNVGFIIPTAFLTQISYKKLREEILTNNWIKNLVRLPNELFGEAAGEVKVDTCIIVVSNDIELSSMKTLILIYDSFIRFNIISKSTAHQYFETTQHDWLHHLDSQITLSEKEEYDIIGNIENNSQKLVDLCDFCLGLTPYDKYTGHTKEQITNRVFHAATQIDETYKKLLKSGDVKRYEIEWNQKEWIKYGDWLAAPREQRFFTEERILVQQIIDWSSLRILSSLTNEELYNTQNQFNLLARDGTNLKYILPVLNSKIITFYHRKKFLDIALQRFQKILIKDAKKVPIRRINFTTSEDERERLFEKAKSLYLEGLIT